MNLVELGDNRLKKMGDTRSYVFEGEEFTASRLNEMGRRLAGGLSSIGIGRGEHVVVSMPNSPEVFACFQAIWRIGAVVVPIHSGWLSWMPVIARLLRNRWVYSCAGLIPKRSCG